MDYKKIYDQLIEARLSIKGERIKQKKSGEYFERHHITLSLRSIAQILRLILMEGVPI
jgi:hypothetical protein